jgi:PEP-CTERM motif-containing protein
MRIKSYYLVALTVTMLLLGTGMASASITMYYNGPEGGALGGVDTYPYGFTINGDNNGGNFYPLICDTFNRGVNPGDQWDANALNMGSLNSTNVSSLLNGGVNGGGSGAVQYYMAAALLFEDARGNPGNAPYDNWAIWYTLDQSDVTSSSYWLGLTSTDQNTIKNAAAIAIAAALHDNPSQFSDVVIYTPTDTSSTGPQEFLGYDTPGGQTPEPSSLALLGSGVVGLAVVLRRKLGV